MNLFAVFNYVHSVWVSVHSVDEFCVNLCSFYCWILCELLFILLLNSVWILLRYFSLLFYSFLNTKNTWVDKKIKHILFLRLISIYSYAIMASRCWARLVMFQIITFKLQELRLTTSIFYFSFKLHEWRLFARALRSSREVPKGP